MRVFSFKSVLCLMGLLAAPASASVIYSYTTDASSYTGNAGTVVPLNIYLQETLTGGSTSYISANGGVSAAGAALNVVSTSGGTAASFGNGSFTASSSFGNPPTAPNTLAYNQGTGAQANNLEFEELITNAQPGVTPTAGKILLGTLNVTVGTGTTTYVLTSLDKDTINNGNSNLGQQNGNTTTEQPAPFGSDLDVTGANYTGANDASPLTITVGPATSAVPEPASLAVFGIGAIGLLARRRRAVVSCD